MDKIKVILLDVCKKIEAQKPITHAEVFAITHPAVEQINELEEEFGDNDSELETEAREVMGADFDHIVHSYGFLDIDVEEVIAPRDW